MSTYFFLVSGQNQVQNLVVVELGLGQNIPIKVLVCSNTVYAIVGSVC